MKYQSAAAKKPWKLTLSCTGWLEVVTDGYRWLEKTPRKKWWFFVHTDKRTLHHNIYIVIITIVIIMIITRSLASPSTFVLLPQCSISHQALTQEATMPANRWTIRAEESCCHDEATGTCMTHVLFKIRDVTLPKSPKQGQPDFSN